MKAHLKWDPIVIYGLNFQGVPFVIRSVALPSYQGLGQTWFVTVIAMCYLLMIVMKKNKKLENWIDHHASGALIIAIFIQIGFSYIGIQLSYFLQFFIGYFISRRSKGDNSWVSRKSIFLVSALTVLFVGIRLLARRSIDGTVLYDLVIARLSFNILAVWIVMVLVRISKISFFEKMIEGRVWRVIDLASYALFLTHYMFLQGPMKVSNLVSNIATQVFLFIIFSITSSAVVISVTERKQIVKIYKE